MILSPNCQALSPQLIQHIPRRSKRNPWAKPNFYSSSALLSPDISKDIFRYVSGLSRGKKQLLSTLIKLACDFKTIYIEQETLAKRCIKKNGKPLCRQTINKYLSEFHKQNLIIKINQGFKKPCLYLVNSFLFKQETAHKLKGIIPIYKLFLRVSFIKKINLLSDKKATLDINIFINKNTNTISSKKSIVKPKTITKKGVTLSDNIELYRESSKKPEIKSQSKENDQVKFKVLSSAERYEQYKLNEKNKIIEKNNPFLDTMKYFTSLRLGKYDDEYGQILVKNGGPRCVYEVLNSDVSTLSDSQKFIYNITVEYYNNLNFKNKYNRI